MKKKLLMILIAASCLCMCACGGDGNKEAGNDKNTQKEEPSYVFTYDGIEVSVNEDIESVVKKLGEPVAYYEAASCAFEGLDKFYTYASFELNTYPKDGKDMLASIYFKDDIVTTTEGLSIGMSKDDMIEAYGEATTVKGNEYVYEKGNGILKFILDGEEIISIEYQTKVDYN